MNDLKANDRVMFVDESDGARRAGFVAVVHESTPNYGCATVRCDDGIHRTVPTCTLSRVETLAPKTAPEVTTSILPGAVVRIATDSARDPFDGRVGIAERFEGAVWSVFLGVGLRADARITELELVADGDGLRHGTILTKLQRGTPLELGDAVEFLGGLPDGTRDSGELPMSRRLGDKIRDRHFRRWRIVGETRTGDTWVPRYGLEASAAGVKVGDRVRIRPTAARDLYEGWEGDVVGVCNALAVVRLAGVPDQGVAVDRLEVIERERATAADIDALAALSGSTIRIDLDGNVTVLAPSGVTIGSRTDPGAATNQADSPLERDRSPINERAMTELLKRDSFEFTDRIRASVRACRTSGIDTPEVIDADRAVMRALDEFDVAHGRTTTPSRDAPAIDGLVTHWTETIAAQLAKQSHGPSLALTFRAFGRLVVALGEWDAAFERALEDRACLRTGVGIGWLGPRDALRAEEPLTTDAMDEP